MLSAPVLCAVLQDLAFLAKKKEVRTQALSFVDRPTAHHARCLRGTLHLQLTNMPRPSSYSSLPCWPAVLSRRYPCRRRRL